MAAYAHSKNYDEAISRAGLRSTRQRHQVFEALMAKRDHPTAVEVFLRVKETMPSISLATVYNCLEALTGAGLVRHVNLERQSSRYCPNLEEHGHFFCDDCGAVRDVPLKNGHSIAETFDLPAGADLSCHSVTLRGRCRPCASRAKLSKNSHS